MWFIQRRAEQAVAPDASIACFSSSFLALMRGLLSLGAGEQQRYALPGFI
jgi:hypothetical protein